MREGGASRAAHAAAGAARAFPTPVGLPMAMHVQHIHPLLDCSWPGQQSERGGFGIRSAGGAPEVHCSHKPAAVLVCS